MKTPDYSQNAAHRMLAKLMKPVAALSGSMALFLPGTMLSATTTECLLIENEKTRPFAQNYLHPPGWRLRLDFSH